MVRLETIYLSNIALYLDNIKTVAVFEQINTKTQDSLRMLRHTTLFRSPTDINLVKKYIPNAESFYNCNTRYLFHYEEIKQSNKYQFIIINPIKTIFVMNGVKISFRSCIRRLAYMKQNNITFNDKDIQEFIDEIENEKIYALLNFRTKPSSRIKKIVLTYQDRTDEMNNVQALRFIKYWFRYSRDYPEHFEGNTLWIELIRWNEYFHLFDNRDISNLYKDIPKCLIHGVQIESNGLTLGEEYAKYLSHTYCGGPNYAYNSYFTDLIPFEMYSNPSLSSGLNDSCCRISKSDPQIFYMISNIKSEIPDLLVTDFTNSEDYTSAMWWICHKLCNPPKKLRHEPMLRNKYGKTCAMLYIEYVKDDPPRWMRYQHIEIAITWVKYVKRQLPDWYILKDDDKGLLRSIWYETSDSYPIKSLC